MGILDLRTVMVGSVISNAICMAVMVSLYLQNRGRSPVPALWPVAYVLQFFGMGLIVLRGMIPDFFSIVVANMLLVVEALMMLCGMEQYYLRERSQRANLAVVAVFTGLSIYYTYAQPSLIARNINFSTALLFFSAQTAWLLLFRIDPTRRPGARIAASIYIAFCLVSLVRILSDLINPPGSSLFTSSLPDTLVILAYQMLFISLTFALMLTVNRRLVSDLEDDIRERRRAEAALRRSEEKFASALQTIPDALVISIADTGKILDVNESFQEISGFTRAEAMGKTSLELKIFSSPADREAFAKEVRRNGHISNLELALRQKSGRIITCQVSGEMLRIEQGECFLMVVRDITERKKMEKAEHEQRILAEALRDTATALNSTLRFNEVLDRILENVGRVTPHDTANIMVIEEGGSALIVRSRGYVELGNRDLNGQRVSLANMPILRRVAASGQPLAIPETYSEPDWTTSEDVQWVNSYAVAPIRVRAHTIGFLNLESAQAGFFTPEQASRLQAFADQASIAIENAHFYEEVQALAVTDPLTGLLNRRGLFQFGEREVLRSLRFQHPLAAVMLDIDHFKGVNDTFGHPAGDQVLRTLAACLRAQLRNVDLIARYGGEEFFLLLTESDQNGAEVLAERVRRTIEAMKVELEGGHSQHVTVSLGIAMLAPDTSTLAGLIERADQAMYAAKNAGRNRVAVGGKDFHEIHEIA